MRRSRVAIAVVPSSAIQRGAPGTFAYVVNADNTVAVRPVVLGPSSGERVAITSGLQPGERMVIDGADKLRAGAKVVVRDPAPRPGATPPGAATPPAGDNPAGRGGGRPR